MGNISDGRKPRAPRPVFWDDNKRIVEVLRLTVRKSGIRQIDLAMKLGKPRAYVSKVLLGQQALSVAEARNICHAIGVSFPEWVKELEEVLRGEAV